MSREILATHPKADLRVYAVWFNVLRSDSREEWDARLLDDRRVEHFWDDRGLVGKWFLHNVTRRPGAEIEWDAYFLYGPDASWTEATEAPRPLHSWGRTIVGSREQLRRDITPLLER